MPPPLVWVFGPTSPAYRTVTGRPFTMSVPSAEPGVPWLAVVQSVHDTWAARLAGRATDASATTAHARFRAFIYRLQSATAFGMSVARRGGRTHPAMQQHGPE